MLLEITNTPLKTLKMLQILAEPTRLSIFLKIFLIKFNDNSGIYFESNSEYFSMQILSHHSQALTFSRVLHANIPMGITRTVFT